MGRPLSAKSKAVYPAMDAQVLLCDAMRNVQQAYASLLKAHKAAKQATGKIEGLDPVRPKPSR